MIHVRNDPELELIEADAERDFQACIFESAMVACLAMACLMAILAYFHTTPAEGNRYESRSAPVHATR